MILGDFTVTFNIHQHHNASHPRAILEPSSSPSRFKSQDSRHRRIDQAFVVFVLTGYAIRLIWSLGLGRGPWGDKYGMGKIWHNRPTETDMSLSDDEAPAQLFMPTVKQNPLTLALPLEISRNQGVPLPYKAMRPACCSSRSTSGHSNIS